MKLQTERFGFGFLCLCLYSLVFCLSFFHQQVLWIQSKTSSLGHEGDAASIIPADPESSKIEAKRDGDARRKLVATMTSDDNTEVSRTVDRAITLTLTDDKQRNWILHNRTRHFNDWWNQVQRYSNGHIHKFRKNADSSKNTDGPILDFVIAGFAKTGTSTLMANLAQMAPMPLKDVCYRVEGIVKRAYGAWSDKYGRVNGRNDTTDDDNLQQQQQRQQELFLKGSKCPRYIGSELSLLQGFSSALPKTKLIIGIRHPVLWFQSFWKMMGNGSNNSITPNDRLKMMCPCAPDAKGQRTCDIQYYNTTSGKVMIDGSSSQRRRRYKCKTECDGGMLYCLARTRFHVALAQLGKTLLTETERQLLARNDVDGGDNLVNMKIRNPIFLYEQTMLQNASTWQDLANYLGVSHIPNTHYQAAHGKSFAGATICLPKYDYLRSQIMVYSYELSRWMVDYFLPVARDPSRPDVTIANMDAFSQMVTTSYRQDPCRRLIRVEDGSDSNAIQYALDPALNVTMWIPPAREIVKMPVPKKQRR